MTTQPSALEQLKGFLNKLFQFESQDLDFGIYKILHYKRSEIKEFIDELLVDKVQEQLRTFSSEELKAATIALQDLEEDAEIQRWQKAIDVNDQARLSIYEEDYAKKIKEYKSLKKQVDAARVADNAEEIIYNNLTQFFSRYYDKGDFISKRRYGKSDKYVVPYNGEETHFYWANHDQYYIKSSEFFQNFSFKQPHSGGTLKVHFKLTEAATEQGNVKAEKNKYFILSEKAPELEGDDLNLYFEFRPLQESEEKEVSGNNKQDMLNAKAAEALKNGLLKQTITAGLWAEDEEKRTVLLRKLNQYTRKNSFDFFIHKDLKGFLQRELDYYIKTELVQVDDLYVLDSEQHFENIRHNFKLIKSFKLIADTIIEFLAQIENFQKQLWEKKKFVLGTEWVITLDKLTEWLEPAAYEPFITAAIQNPDQLAEWKNLFGDAVLPKWEDLTIDDLKADLHTWRKLPIDTSHYTSEFKLAMLTSLSEKINLEEEANGLIMHSDNYHGLQLLQEKLREQVKATYIDPPYNTDATEILYKNAYKHSSWNSLLYDRIDKAKYLAKSDGIVCITIDDYELNNLSFIADSVFGSDNNLGTVCIRNNPSGRSTVKGFAVNHEYALFYSNSRNSITVGRLSHNEAQIERYDQTDANGKKFEWENLRKSSAGSNRSDRPKQFYPIYYNTLSGKIRLPKLLWQESLKSYDILENEGVDEVVLWPIDQAEDEKVWRIGLKKANSDKDALLIKNNKGQIEIYGKKYLNESGVLPRTWWDDPKYSARDNGTRELKKLFNSNKKFDFPKSVCAVVDCLKVSLVQDNDIILDYFPGSGTTFQAVQILNRKGEGKRKCVLVEQGNHAYSIIIPRVKKIAYSYDWKKGQPQNMNGLGVFLKYQRLEQYEEALENIAFTAPAGAVQKALTFDQYLPKYFLEFETRDSKSLVNVSAMQNPWGYSLKVWDGYTYDTEQYADLVETFNYLIGLHMQKHITREHYGHRYTFVWGHNNAQKKSLVIWRDTTNWKEADYDQDRDYIVSQLEQFEHEQLYINGQSTVPGALMVEDVFKTAMIPN